MPRESTLVAAGNVSARFYLKRSFVFSGVTVELLGRLD